MSDINDANELHRKAIRGGASSKAEVEFVEFMLSRWPAIYDEVCTVKRQLASAKAEAKNSRDASWSSSRLLNAATRQMALMLEHQEKQAAPLREVGAP